VKTEETHTNELRRRAEEAVAEYVIEARDRGREVAEEVRAIMVETELRRLTSRSEKATEPAEQPVGLRLPPIRRLLGREVSEEEYQAAQELRPEPPAVLCRVCGDSGFRVTRRELVNREQIVGARIDVWQGRTLGADECVIHCEQCPAATQRSRLLRGTMPPGDISRARFERFEARSDSQASALVWSRKWAARETSPHTLILVGPVGVGKTHLAKAAALYRAEHGEPVVWQTSAEILETIRATFNRLTAAGAESDPARAMTLAEWQRVPVLAIDDLGSEQATDWTLSAIEQIVFHRYEHERPTIITSNLTLAQMAERQEDPHGRLVSRLADKRTDRRSIYVEIKGSSYREGSEE
jgi:DNA replication protein DnaC